MITMKKTEADLIQLQNHTHQKNQMDQGSDNMKQGDALSLPKGWVIKKLGEVVDIINGRNQSAVISDKGQYPIYGSAGNLMGFATDYLCEEGTTIIGRKGNISNPIYIEEKFWNVDTAFGLYPKNGYSTKFIYFLCQTIDFKSRNRGTTIPSLVKSDLLTIDVPFICSLPEQQRIVSILDEAFSVIERSRNNAEQNLKNAKELFESYLQGVFENGNWETKTLKEVAKIFGRGKSKHRPRNWEGLYGGNYPFIQTGEVRNANKYISSYTQTYNEVGLAQSKLWKKGTICITIAANIAETAILDFDACIPDSIIGFEVDEKKADLNFAYYLLQYFKAELQKLGKGSAQDNINLGTFENQYFPFPTVKEQQTIVRQLDALRAETQKLEAVYQKKIDDLEELKKSILQKAFAGELKVSEPLINAD
jgi:type I restriction enzyme S subunit